MPKQTYTEFVAKHKIKMRAETTSYNRTAPNSWPVGTRHFKCVLKCSSRTFTIYYSMGPALKGEPTIEDVMYCMALDTHMLISGEYEEIGVAKPPLERQTEGLKRLLGDDAILDELLYETDDKGD